MRRLTAVGSMLLIIASALAGRDAAPAFHEKLAIQIGHFDSGGRTLVETVVALAYQYQLPTGFEYLVQPAARQKLDLKLKNISVKGALAAVAVDVSSAGHPLQCGDSILIVGLGAGAGTVKTATDSCPACNGKAQVDDYNTSTACSLTSLGTYMTIRTNR